MLSFLGVCGVLIINSVQTFVCLMRVCVFMICEQTAKAFFFSLNLNVLSLKTRKRFKLILSFLLFHSRYKESSHKISSVIRKDKLKNIDLLSLAVLTFISLSGISLLDSISFWSLFLRARAEFSPSLSHTFFSHSRQQDVTKWSHRLQRMQEKERIKQREDSPRNEKRDLFFFMALLQLPRKCFGCVCLIILLVFWFRNK